MGIYVYAQPNIHILNWYGASVRQEMRPRSSPSCLSEYILGPFATLGSLPVDVLSRDLDIARLTVNAASEMLV